MKPLGRFLIMINSPKAKTVVTVLVIVWYVLEIILKLEQLLC